MLSSRLSLFVLGLFFMQQPVVRVGEWLVTPSVNQISRKGRQLTLEPRLIDLLVFFARHPDEVLSRDELIDNVWTRNVVTSHVVTQSVSELRKSLKDGDDSSMEYIATVPKRGYKLTVPVIWCTEEGEELTPVIPAETPTVAVDAPSVSPQPEAAAPEMAPVAKPEKRKRLSTFIVWGLFLLALASCVALVALSTLESRPPVTKTRILLNPRDVDIHLLSGNTCNNWSSQHSYAIGLGSLITTSLNTFSTFMVHDKTNYNINEPSSSGKTLTIEFVNQLLMNGDVDSLGKASSLLADVNKQSPDFTYAWAEKALVDVLRHSQQPLDDKQLADLYSEITRVGNMPGIKDMAIFYQIKTVDMLGKGKVDEAYSAINSGIDLEMSWMNYVLLGKVYEMKGQNREAADAYLTAFNLRPGENTFYWIENAVFQTSVTRVVPYLDNFLASE